MKSQRIKCEESGKVVVLLAESSRRVQVSPIYKGGEVYENGKLVALNFDNEFEIKNGEAITIKRQRYMVNSISKIMSTDEKHIIGYHLNIANLNKSSMFIMPFLGYDRKYFKWQTDFVNCFIETELDDTPSIYLWYKYIPTVEMEHLENKLSRHPDFDSQKDVDQYHVLYRFNIPKKYLNDYNLILKGKYSYISEVAKERILNFHFSSKDRPLGNILYRDPKRRERMEKDLNVKIPEDLDLHDPFYKKEEVYLEKYKIPKSPIDDVADE